jgi:hypothetical protein
MKKLIIFLLLPLMFKAQEKFSTYQNSFGDDKERNIRISTKDKEKYTLYIDAIPMDKLFKDGGGIQLTEKQNPDFIKALETAKLKYEEWVKTAKENNVTELRKEMSVKPSCAAFFRAGSEWHFQFKLNLTFAFIIIKSGEEVKYLVTINTGKVTSSSNQFTTVDGFSIIFASVDEIDKFKEAISIEKINEFIAKPKEKDLFKE